MAPSDRVGASAIFKLEGALVRNYKFALRHCVSAGFVSEPYHRMKSILVLF